MKNIIIFLFTTLIYSQNTNKVLYKVAQVEEESYISKLSPEVKTKLQETKKELNKLTLELIFNDSVSVFTRGNGILTNTIEENLAISKAGVKKDIYTSLRQNKSFRNNNNDFLHKPNEFLIYFDLEFDWKITNEKKTIDSIEVIKAIGKVYKNESYQEVIVWFAPKLPYQFGPIGVGKLPGLILELQLGTLYYTAKKIEIGIKNIEIKLPNEGKLIEDKEHLKILKDRFEILKKNSK